MKGIIENALLLAQHYPVFPCLPSKAPACPTGFKAAVRDPDGVQRLFRQHPTATLIGVPTGEASGFDALDLDGPDGAGRWWAKNRDRIPVTRAHRTRSGGLHVLFRHHPSVRNTASKIAPGVDTRGTGGYLIWWPAAEYPVHDAPLTEWPDWLLELLAPPPPATPMRMPIYANDTGKSRRYALSALRNAVERIAVAGKGLRNQTLNDECFALCRFIRTGDLTLDEIAGSLAAAALGARLTSREIEATLISALRAGGSA